MTLDKSYKDICDIFKHKLFGIIRIQECTCALDACRNLVATKVNHFSGSTAKIRLENYVCLAITINHRIQESRSFSQAFHAFFPLQPPGDSRRSATARISAFAGIWTEPDHARSRRSCLTKKNSSPMPLRASSESGRRIYDSEVETAAITVEGISPAEMAANGLKSAHTTRKCWGQIRRTRFCWETTANFFTRCVKPFLKQTKTVESFDKKEKKKSERFEILTGGERHGESRGILRKSDSREPWRWRIAFSLRNAYLGNAEGRRQSQILLWPSHSRRS